MCFSSPGIQETTTREGKQNIYKCRFKDNSNYLTSSTNIHVYMDTFESCLNMYFKLSVNSNYHLQKI